MAKGTNSRTVLLVGGLLAAIVAVGLLVLIVAYIGLGSASDTDKPVSSGETSGAQAIQIAKEAFVSVNGSVSSMNLQDSVQWYLNIQGSEEPRMGDGWTASQIDGNTAEVTLDFINYVSHQPQHETAIWEVNLTTKQVICKNQNATYLSWVPAE